MKYLIAVSLFVFSQILYAGDFNFSKRFGVGGGAGWTFPIQGNDFDDIAEDDFMWSLHARYHMTEQDALQFEYSHHDFSKTDINANIFELMYINRLNPTHKMTPIVGIGAGFADMADIEPYENNAKFAAKARLGFEYAFNDNVVGTIFADYLFVGKMPGRKESSPLKKLPGQEIYALVPQFTLTVFFGEKKEEKKEEKVEPQEGTTVIVPVVSNDNADEDEDNDGVLNNRDRCPGTKPGARVNSHGCIPEEKAMISISKTTQRRCHIGGKFVTLST